MITKYQLEFVKMLEEGLSQQEIADKLFVDVETIKQYYYRLRKKLNIKTKQELIDYYKGVDK